MLQVEGQGRPRGASRSNARIEALYGTDGLVWRAAQVAPTAKVSFPLTGNCIQTLLDKTKDDDDEVVVLRAVLCWGHVRLMVGLRTPFRYAELSLLRMLYSVFSSPHLPLLLLQLCTAIRKGRVACDLRSAMTRPGPGDGGSAVALEGRGKAYCNCGELR
jgi:hypothetical protein